MRFFKYLFFIFILSSTSTFAATKYSLNNVPSDAIYSTREQACLAFNSAFTQILNFAEDMCRIYSPSQDNVAVVKIYRHEVQSCPSATQKTLSVPRNSGAYTCVSQCQYAIQGCVQVDFQVGNPDGGDRTKMTCNAISTGKECGGGSSGGGSGTGSGSGGTGTGSGTGTGTGTGSGTGTGNAGSNSNNDGSNAASNSATSNTTNNSTSISNSTTTTTNNTTNNTSTSTTTTTTNTTNNNTTNTSMDLSSLENTVNNNGSNLSSKLDEVIKAIKDKVTGGDGDGDGGGDGEKTDLTATNAKLDAINQNGKDQKSLLESIKDFFTEDAAPGDGNGTLEIKEIVPVVEEKQYLSWSASCPFGADSTAITINGQTTSLASDLTSWCQMAIDVKPFVIAAGAIIAFMIASGVSMGNKE